MSSHHLLFIQDKVDSCLLVFFWLVGHSNLPQVSLVRFLVVIKLSGYTWECLVTLRELLNTPHQGDSSAGICSSFLIGWFGSEFM